MTGNYNTIMNLNNNHYDNFNYANSGNMENNNANINVSTNNNNYYNNIFDSIPKQGNNVEQYSNSNQNFGNNQNNLLIGQNKGNTGNLEDLLSNSYGGNKNAINEYNNIPNMGIVRKIIYLIFIESK